jgi:hypothetical protein
MSRLVVPSSLSFAGGSALPSVVLGAKKKAAAEWLEHHKAEQVAVADAALATENRRRSLDERGAAWRFSASATPGCG